jgi:hypothetical protein
MNVSVNDGDGTHDDGLLSAWRLRGRNGERGTWLTERVVSLQNLGDDAYCCLLIHLESLERKLTRLCWRSRGQGVAAFVQLSVQVSWVNHSPMPNDP